MAARIIPAFARFPQEASIIGHLLAGYGELEFELYNCLKAVLDDGDAAMRTVFRTRGEEQRILIADALMRGKFNAIGLIHPYAEAIADMGWCRRTRNQFAHCHWAVLYGQLAFTNLEEAAKSPVGRVTITLHPISLTLLQEQADYFWYVMECFWHLSHEYQRLVGRLQSHTFPLPTKLARPLRHSATP
jgi:hypothetical protein